MPAEGTARETTSDGTLLERVAKKDEDALSALYDRYCAVVFSEAKRILHDTGRAEEVLQDLFYALWQGAGRFDRAPGSFAGWLLLAARNRSLQLLRPEDSVNEERFEMEVALPWNVESHTTQILLHGRIQAVLGSLSAAEREAVESVFFEGRKVEEIAARAARPIEAVRAGLRRTMAVLKRAVQ